MDSPHDYPDDVDLGLEPEPVDPAVHTPKTDAILKRQADAPGPSLVRRIDPQTGRVLELLDPHDPSRNPFRYRGIKVPRRSTAP